MVGFLWQSILFPPRNAKPFQNLGKKKIVKALIKIQTYIHCCGWILSTIFNIFSSHCQVFSKSWQENSKCQGGDKDSNLHSLLWWDFFDRMIINSATHCQVFSKNGKKNRNVKAEIKIQTYIHCYGWITLTFPKISVTHWQVFSKSWQEKKF